MPKINDDLQKELEDMNASITDEILRHREFTEESLVSLNNQMEDLQIEIDEVEGRIERGNQNPDMMFDYGVLLIQRENMARYYDEHLEALAHLVVDVFSVDPDDEITS